MYSNKEIETIFKTICNKIEEGKPLRQILMEKDMPSTQTFYKWIDEDELKSKRYARAKELYADSMFDDILLISDGTGDDVLTDEEGRENVNHNVIQRDRLRTDNRKWVLSKLNPKKYGDNSQLRLTDNEGEPLKVNAIFSADILKMPE